MPELLFSYKPRTHGRFALWFFLLGPIFLTIAVVQSAQSVNLAERDPGSISILILITVVVWLACILMMIFLTWVRRLVTRNNIVSIDDNGLLYGSFGGFKRSEQLTNLKRLELLPDRTMTKIWVEAKDGSPRKLLMAFMGRLPTEEKSRFEAAVKKFNVECVMGY